ncbi:molybdopterin molybdotransferase MoeA [Kribbella albertanoniae]|uniref:Molybdopterin molybdenumtransferase n=1 Tax=Kribbella albertanoniae TaxID=1266829 RepID=A0A4R4Q4P8_9ACTN|nr:gephyrin-like molybdotransferase Glp [Kribbella albertanoniae]TDC30044.1 molybdopterin molybdenumtransferase MoeA [Kribbella albertanoniae]
MKRSVEEHLEAVLGRVTALPAFDQPLMEALGLVLAEDIVSGVSLPGFDNSAMDGYAVRAEDLAGASAEAAITLPVIGEQRAGQSVRTIVTPGTCMRIMTGAPMPRGADSVVPVEWTDGGTVNVRIDQQPPLGGSVRRFGEDVQAGQQVLERDTLLGPRQIAVLAAVGRARVKARPRPRVVVVSTGSELRELGTALGEGQIYDSNSYTMAACARAAGAEVYRVGVVDDDAKKIMDTLNDQLSRADLVITTGGVSKGAYDVVKEVLSKTGSVDFPEVAMQPGKPQGFGVLGADEVPIFTLPGNPVSAYVSFEVFVRPALRKLMGQMPYQRSLARGVSLDGFNSPSGKRQFVRAAARSGDEGWMASTVGGHGSHLLGGLSRANALIVVPEDVTSVRAGDQVELLLLDEETG